MSSPSRLEPAEMIDAHAQAGALLAADADRAREARDWRAAAAGGPPAAVARDTTPDRWNCYVTFGVKAARQVAIAAKAEGMTPSEYVRETVLADLALRGGIDVADLRENLSVRSRPRGNRARALRI